MFSFFYDTKKEDMNALNNNGDQKSKEEDYTELINEFKELRTEINSMYSSLKEREVAGLDLEKLIKFFNLFGKKFLKEEEIGYEKNIKGIITVNLSSGLGNENNQEEEQNIQNLNLVLNGGKKIILTENSNLNMFNYDELVEILRLLDTLIVDKSKDSLRGNIVNQINSISMVSFIKNT